jgi:hypothetical protein
LYPLNWRAAAPDLGSFSVTILTPLVVGIVEFLARSQLRERRRGYAKSYLGKRHVRNDNDVQRRRSILLDAGVAAGVVLVRACAAVVLPRLAVGGFRNGSLGRGTCWGACSKELVNVWCAHDGHRLTEMPSCKAKDTTHDAQKNLRHTISAPVAGQRASCPSVHRVQGRASLRS